MKKKDLAEEYLDRKIKQEPFKSLTKGFEYAFSVDDIKAAFNAGRKSVFDDFPKLLYKEEEDGLLAVDVFDKVCLIHKLKGDSRYVFVVDYKASTQRYDTLEEAKLAANEDYKKRIKQALGL